MINGQGQGGTTEYKQRCIQAALTINMRVCGDPSKHISRFPYWHVDLNCGSGWNEQAGCIGTPLAFLEAARLSGKTNYQAFFCDESKPAIVELLARAEFGHNERSYLFHGDNAEVLEVFGECIRARGERPEYAMGSIVCDPNGWFYGHQVPRDGLHRFCSAFPRIDLVLNLNVRNRQLINGCIKGGRWGDRECLGVAELPTFLNRKHWLIRKVLQKGGDRFVLMIGRNYPFGENRALGFFKLDSPAGARIVDEIESRECALPITENIEATLFSGL